jgi:hypothetical protein
MNRRVFLSGVLIGATPLRRNDAADGVQQLQPAATLDHQVSITASTTGRFREGFSWNLSVNSAGRAHLVVDSRPATKSREFTVSTAQIQELLEVMRTERFFELKGPYGEEIPDGSTRVLTIVDGGIANTVSIGYLMGWVLNAPRKLKEPARAVRVFRTVRSWFKDSEAVDLTRFDDRVLETVARVE